jgi:TolB-like protein
MGDVTPQGEDLLGDGVNIAARLEGVAAPDGVAMSAAVSEAVRGKIPFALSDQGEKTLKNIAQPMRVFFLGAPGVAGARPVRAVGRVRRCALAAAVGLALSGATVMGWWFWQPRLLAPAAAPTVQQVTLSIVVLPFANLSGDPAQAYVADGLSSRITADLSRISGSLDIAVSSANTCRNREVDVHQVGRELDVSYASQGAVQRGGGRYRVNVSLADTSTVAQLWAERMEGPDPDQPERDARHPPE